MSTERTSFTAVLADDPHTRPLKQGLIVSDGVRCVFPTATPLYRAFARMVRGLEFDVCEMALVQG